MTEFGHQAARLPCGGHIDSWGTGPFCIEVAGALHRFEDSDRFGPLRLTQRDMPTERQWGERHPFWAAHRLWRQQGRRLAEDGQTCIWEQGKPTVIMKVSPRVDMVVASGDEDGPVLDFDTPEGQAALRAAKDSGDRP